MEGITIQSQEEKVDGLSWMTLKLPSLLYNSSNPNAMEVPSIQLETGGLRRVRTHMFFFMRKTKNPF